MLPEPPQIEAHCLGIPTRSSAHFSDDVCRNDLLEEAFGVGHDTGNVYSCGASYGLREKMR